MACWNKTFYAIKFDYGSAMIQPRNNTLHNLADMESICTFRYSHLGSLARNAACSMRAIIFRSSPAYFD